MVDVIYCFLLLFFFVKGFLIGDSKEVFGLVAMVCSCLVAMYPANGIIEDLVRSGLPEEIGHILGYGAGACFAFPFVYLLIDFLTKNFQYFGDRLNLAKRILGSMLSLLKGLAFLVILSTVLTQLPLKSKMLEKSIMVDSLRLY